MDRLFINNLQFDVIIGVYDFERTQKQRVIVDIEMVVDTREAAATDALDKTVDYDGVVQKIGALMSANQCLLIEALTEKVADLVLTEFDISWTKVTLKKPGALPGEAYVALCIERGCSRPN
ncbi:MAG: dihydroneopterin aldolase [Gammaproteobacteria bacterium]|nr:dihydroneopterin aldolase [Gammaproteobacteria bacterium]